MSQYTGSREQGYTRADVQLVFEKGTPSGWGEAIHWLEAEGLDEPGMPRESAAHMISDFRCLDVEDVGFTSDIDEAYSLAMEHCPH